MKGSPDLIMGTKSDPKTWPEYHG